MSPAAPAVDVDVATLPSPGLARRMACFFYEGVLLFGVVTVAGLLWSIATGQRHALQGMHGLQAFLFVVLGAYFTWFWTRSGQTLAMQTWHVRLLRADGGRVTPPQAVARYLLCWVWFLPALALVRLAGVTGSAATFAALAAGVAAYAGLSLLHPQRQYWHDAVCGTRLVTWRPRPPVAAQTVGQNPGG